MTASSPLLTVMLPVYNAETYLAEAVESVLQQSFDDFELIAVNDGSTDRSLDMLRAIADQDSRMKVIDQSNGGVSSSCNIAIDQGCGRYVARMDADDIAMSTRFERQITAMEEDPNLVALGTQVRLIDPEGRVLRHLKLPISHEEIDARHISGKGILSICNPSVMMRMDAVRRVGKYDLGFRSAHDIEIFLRLAEVGRLGNLDETLLDYRMHFSSIGHKGRSRQRHFAWQAAEMAARRRGQAFSEPEPDATAPDDGPADLFRKWGWWALKDGELGAARHYGRRALASAPFDSRNWRLLASALRGR